jgi:hypothetical protein
MLRIILFQSGGCQRVALAVTKHHLLCLGGAVFGWPKRKPAIDPVPADLIASQPPGENFVWPKGAILTAVDELILALPVALFDKDRPMSEFVFGPDDMELSAPPGSDTFFVKLMPGMSVSLAKSCQSHVVADDNRARRIKVTPPAAEA